MSYSADTLIGIPCIYSVAAFLHDDQEILVRETFLLILLLLKH